MATQYEQRPRVDEVPPAPVANGGTPVPAPSMAPASPVYPASAPYPYPQPRAQQQEPSPVPTFTPPPYAPTYPPQTPVEADLTRLARGRMSGLFWLAFISLMALIPLSAIARDVVVTFGGGFGHWVFSMVVLGAIIVGLNLTFAVSSRLPR